MRNRFLFVVAILVAMAVPTAVLAASDALKFDDIRTQQAEIRAGVMARTGRYKDMSETTRSELLRRQQQVLATIEGKQVPNDLNPVQRTEVFNHLEWIEAAINNAEDERLVCEYRTTIGSNRKQRVCRTVQQMREDRERARDQMLQGNIQLER